MKMKRGPHKLPLVWWMLASFLAYQKEYWMNVLRAKKLSLHDPYLPET